MVKVKNKLINLFVVAVTFVGLVFISYIMGTPVNAENPLYQIKTLAVDRNRAWKRFIDYEAGVVCYSYDNDGTSCLLLEQTRMGLMGK